MASPRVAVVPRVKGLNCPSCGAALTIRAAAHTLTVVCENCHSILDAKDPNLQVLQKFESKVKVRPQIPLGSRGELAGYTWEVIGFQVRTIVVEGISYAWREYLLFNPYKGFRYLTEYDGHWNQVRTVRAVPEPAGGTKPSLMLTSQKYTHFQTATARTTYVLGEFPWQVRVGEAAEVKDYISPPWLLSSETTGAAQPAEKRAAKPKAAEGKAAEGKAAAGAAAEGEQPPGAGTGWSETVWSLGEYTPGALLWKTFKLSGNPPKARGIFSNQPSPYKGRVRGIWGLSLKFALALVALAIFFAVAARREQVFRGTYNFTAQAPGAAENSFVTDVFELKGRTSTVELTTNTNLNNNWVYFNFALINNDTGEAYDFGREVSYYFGSDSDGSWTEGSVSDTALIPSVPAGRYYLRIEPERDPGGASVFYEVKVRRDVPAAAFFWIAAGFLFVPPIFVSIRAAGFEGKRWQESDYATTSSSSSSDDNGDDD